MSDIALVQCITGNFTKVNEVPSGFGGDAFMYYTNDTEEVFNEIVLKGWNPVLLSLEEGHTEDLGRASIQSKEVKFFNIELPVDYSYAFYIDHKLIIQREQVEKLLDHLGDDYCMFGEQGGNAYDEFYHCMHYDRYVDQKTRIQDNINWYRLHHGDDFVRDESRPMVNTSYGLYNLKKHGFREFMSRIHDEQHKWDHAECQIMFSLYYRANPEGIKLVPTHSIIGEIERNMPEPLIGHKMY